MSVGKKWFNVNISYQDFFLEITNLFGIQEHIYSDGIEIYR